MRSGSPSAASPWPPPGPTVRGRGATTASSPRMHPRRSPTSATSGARSTRCRFRSCSCGAPTPPWSTTRTSPSCAAAPPRCGSKSWSRPVTASRATSRSSSPGSSPTSWAELVAESGPAGTARYRSRSLWLDTVPDTLTPRPALSASVDADVAIVGGGFTGLWTAYELLRREPSLRVVIVEAEIAGFGASGRNGGWVSSFFAGSRAATAKAHGRDAAIALQRAMYATVDEVGRVLAEEGIDAHFHKGGTLDLATRAPHVARLRELVDSERRWGFGEDDIRWLDATEASARINAE